LRIGPSIPTIYYSGRWRGDVGGVYVSGICRAILLGLSLTDHAKGLFGIFFVEKTYNWQGEGDVVTLSQLQK
jgi:hypothetical protein